MAAKKVEQEKYDEEIARYLQEQVMSGRNWGSNRFVIIDTIYSSWYYSMYFLQIFGNCQGID